MPVQIISQALHLRIFGYGGTAADKNYGSLAFALSGKMWQNVKANAIANKGKNIWVYDANHEVFAGVELENPADGLAAGLEEKTIVLEKYALYHHTGPYRLIPSAGQMMRDEISRQGLTSALPYIEIYGHWVSDENKLETTLLTRVL